MGALRVTFRCHLPLVSFIERKKEKQLINKSKKKNERQKREIPCKISITYQMENQSAWSR